jgi:hypothetical protein
MGYRRVLMEVRRVFALASLLAVWPCGFVPAQVGASTTADIAANAGPDRTETLIAGAKKEGTVTLYTSANVEDMAVVTSAFEKKYGVKVRTLTFSRRGAQRWNPCTGKICSRR